MKRLIVGLAAATLTLAPAAAQRISTLPNRNYVTIPNYTANGGLPIWQACRAKVITNWPVTYCKVLEISDSTGAGVAGSYNYVGSDARAFSRSSQLAYILSTFYGVYSSTASVVGPAGIGLGTTLPTYAAYDTRVSGATWNVLNQSPPTIGGGYFYNSDTTTLSFNPADSAASFTSNVAQTDTLDLIAIGYTTGGAGTINVNVNGGATVGSLNTSATENFVEGTISTTLGSNTWGLTCSSGTSFACLPIIWRAYNSTKSEVSIMNAGWSSATTAMWTNTGDTPFDPLSTIAQIAPTLCIINLMINDANQLISTTTFQTNTQALITKCKSAGADVLLVSPNPSKPFGGSIFTASQSGNTLTVGTAESEPLAAGQTVINSSGTTIGTITTFGSGTGGVGTYTLNTSATVASEAMTAGISYAQQQTYVKIYASLAASNNIPFLDMWANFCGKLSGSTCPNGGWQAGMGAASNGAFNTTPDPLHMGAVGYGRFAEFEAQVLMQ